MLCALFVTSEDAVDRNYVYVSKILASSEEIPKYPTKKGKKKGKLSVEVAF